MKIVFGCLVLLFSSASLAADDVNTASTTLANTKAPQAYYDDRERGWYWYEKQAEKKPEPEPEKKQEQVQVPTQPALTPREILKQQGENWENALADAILNPTPENYQNYLAMTTRIQQQSQDFATGFKQAIWVTPEYDYALTNPTTTQAIVAKNEQDQIAHEGVIKSLSQSNGLIFFFRSDCQFCHRFAPVLKKFAEHYGFTIIPVSLDGAGIQEFPYPKKNYDLGRKLKVDVVPALFLVNPDTNTVVTVGYGYADWSTLTQKLLFAGQQIAKR